MIVEQIASSHWQGPMPPPQALAAFESAVPGAGHGIVEDFRENSAHEREMERLHQERSFILEQRELELRDRDSERKHEVTKRGQIYALVLALGCCAGGSAIALAGGSAVLAGVFALSPVVALAAVFTIGKFISIKAPSVEVRTQDTPAAPPTPSLPPKNVADHVPTPTPAKEHAQS